jgi:hypothetical protein
MAFPNQKHHRTNRRALGRNTQLPIPPASVVVTSAADVVTITYSKPVVVSGPVALTVATLSGGVTAQTSPTTATVTFTSAVSTKAWTYEGGDPNVAATDGGQVAGATGTFS